MSPAAFGMSTLGQLEDQGKYKVSSWRPGVGRGSGRVWDGLEEEEVDIVDAELGERLVERRLKLVGVEVDAEYLNMSKRVEAKRSEGRRSACCYELTRRATVRVELARFDDEPLW